MRSRGAKEFVYCEDIPLARALFKRKSATHFLVVDFRPGCENRSDINIARRAANAVDRLLRDHLLRIAAKEPEEQMQLAESLEVVRLECVIRDETAARAVGQQTEADVVLWGDAVCPLRTAQGQPLVNIIPTQKSEDQSTLISRDTNIYVEVSKGEIGSFCARATMTSAGWPVMGSGGAQTQSAAVLEGANLELPQVVAGDALGLTLFVGGLHFFKRGEYPHALNLFRGAASTLRTDSQSAADLFWAIGWTEYMAGRFDTAAGLFSRCESLAGEMSEMWWSCREAQLDALTAASQVPQALVLAQETLERARVAQRRSSEARSLQGIGNLALLRDELDTARKKYEEALALFRDIGEKRGEATSLQGLGNLALRQGELDTVRERFEEALALFRDMGEKHGEATSLQGLGILALRQGALDTVRERFEEALALCQDIGSKLCEADALQGLGGLALRQREWSTTRTRYEKALALYRAIHERMGEANTLQGLGELALRQGEMDTGRTRYEEALLLFQVIGYRPGEANTLTNLGDLALFQGELDTARKKYEEALALFRDIGEKRGEATSLQGLGNLALRQGELDTARKRYEEALRVYRALGDGHGEANTLSDLADCAVATEQYDEADQLTQQAISIFVQLRDRSSAARNYVHHGLSLKRRGELLRAREALIRAHQLSVEAGDTSTTRAVLIFLKNLDPVKSKPSSK